MKYKLLAGFRDYLDGAQDLSDNTKRKYFQSVKALFEGLEFEAVEDIPPQLILERLKRLKTKNDVSAATCGLRFFQGFAPTLILPTELSEVAMGKKNRKKRSFEPISLDTIHRKVRNIKNPQIRYAFELMEETGLRVSEVAGIRRKDLLLDDEDRLHVYVSSFKGGKEGYRVVNNERLEERLIALARDKPLEEKVFYSASYLERAAGELGLECHDFRRCFARKNYARLKKEVGAYKAKEEVRILMAHSDMRTTKRYLRREIKL